MRTLSSSIYIIISALFISQSVSAMTPAFPTKATKVMTQGINHLRLTVKNLQASTDFFVNSLGWKR